MIKYHFTGHLTPRPKGTESAMCELSGEVYLATDVEYELHMRAEAHKREIVKLREQIQKLNSKVISARHQRPRRSLSVGKSE
jgi:hypothetical protein